MVPSSPVGRGGGGEELRVSGGRGKKTGVSVSLGSTGKKTGGGRRRRA